MMSRNIQDIIQNIKVLYEKYCLNKEEKQSRLQEVIEI